MVLARLDQALARRPSADLHAARAFARASENRLPAALEDMDRAVALSPRSAPFLGYRGFLRNCLRDVDGALRDLDRAVALDPKESDYRLWRAGALFTRFRLREALRDLEPFCSGPAWLAHAHFRKGMALALLGRPREARRVVGQLAARPEAHARGWSLFLDGVLRFYDGDRAGACRSLARAAAAPAPPDDPERLGLLRRAAALARWKGGSMKKRRLKSGRLIMMGVGVSPPRNITLAILEGVERCDTVFVNLAGDTLVELLSLFCRDIRPITYETKSDMRPAAREMIAECRKGRTVGYVTIGNVMVFGPLTKVLMAECRKAGVPCEGLPAVSLADDMLSRLGMVLGGEVGGFQVYDCMEMARPGFTLNPRVPTAVYFTNVAPDRRRDLFAAIRRSLLASFPPGHRLGLFDPRFGPGGRRELPLAKLGADPDEITSQTQVFIPPVRGRS